MFQVAGLHRPVPPGVGREPRDVPARPYHDFTSHAADVHRYAAVMENAMSNEEERPYVDDGEEEHEDIYD
jgi:hypothetical protein